jgi:ubiquinone/menaquinone biosynthesis C-methylase UbiE
VAGKTSNIPHTQESEAVTRLRLLLDEAHRNRPFDPQLGYLDLLDNDKRERSPVMYAMHLPLVTKIYERWWRPGLGRLMKGFGGPSMQAEYQLASEMLDLTPGDVVLDLGCGPGNFSRRFARTVAPDGLVVGYDGSRPMLIRAVLESRREQTPALAFVLGDATELPFKDDSFDAACCFAALHMFPNPLRSLDEVARVLKRSGRVALLTSYAPEGKRGRAMKLIGPASGQRMFGREEIRNALETRGFELETQQIAGVAQLIGARLR